MKNHFLSFIDWYINNKEGKGSRYIEKFFKNDNEKFIDAIFKYAVEFSISSSFNPFLITKEKEREHILKIDDFLKKDSNFLEFSKKENNHMPRAILGNKNYLQYLKETLPNEDSRVNNIEDVSAEIIVDNNNSFELKYDFNFLFNNFKLRLITQDRFYESLNFPISLLKRIFGNLDNSTFFEDWLHESIINIKFHTHNKTLLFSEINFIEINNEGFVNLTNHENEVFELVNKRDNGDIVKLQINDLSELAIDHIVPFNEFYLKNKERFIVLQRIHNALLNINNNILIKKRGKDFTEAKNVFFKNFSIKRETIDQLKNELIFINDKVDLQMMQRSENLLKNRKA